MWPYWVLFLIPALMAFHCNPRSNALQRGRWSAGLWIYWVFMVFMIGLRDQIGADWDNYLRIFNQSAGVGFWEIFVFNDPGYAAINWLSNQLDSGIAGVNLVSGAIFASGLIVFSQSLSRPWLALLIAVPFIVIVIAMSLTRQAVALGLIMLGLVWLQRGNYWRYLFWVFLAATFHRTALIMMPLAVVILNGRHIHVLLITGFLFVAGFFLFLADEVNYFMKVYIESELNSDGAMIRLLMSLIPAIIFLVLMGDFDITSAQKKIWVWLSVLSIASFCALALSQSSTAVDRLAFFLAPLQLMIFSNLPDVFARRFHTKKHVWLIAIVGYYASVQFVWLTFAVHANSWLPYRTVIPPFLIGIFPRD
jgi:hypothetical protein